jgi:hypothetical protein
MNIDEVWRVLDNLKVVTIVAASPRPGSDFFHSLLDNHAEILTFDGWLLFHNFYEKSISVYGTKRFAMGIDSDLDVDRLDEINIVDFFYEFAWSHLHKFNSSYDNLENKDSLGIERNQHNSTDIDVFVKNAVDIISKVPFSRRNALLAIYASFEMSNGGSIGEKKILLHSVHLPEYIPSLLNDFPNLKIMACVRDPRVYATKILNYHRIMPLSKTSIGVNNAYLRLALDGVSIFNESDFRVVLLEALHSNPKRVMQEVCLWLDIKYKNSLLESTWNGKYWFGDSLSFGIDKFFDIQRYAKDKELWAKDLSVLDLIVIESLMHLEMISYGYNLRFKSSIWRYLSFVFVLFPTKYEIKLLLTIINTKSFFNIFYLGRSMIIRYLFSYKKLFYSLFNNKNKFIVFRKYNGAQGR